MRWFAEVSAEWRLARWAEMVCCRAGHLGHPFPVLVCVWRCCLSLCQTIGQSSFVLPCCCPPWDARNRTWDLLHAKQGSTLELQSSPLFLVARLNLNDVTKQQRLDLLNNIATVLVFITVIVNIFITAFGVQKTGLYPSIYGRRLY